KIVSAQMKSKQKVLKLEYQVKKLSDMLEGMEEVTKRRNFNLCISSSENDLEEEMNDKGIMSVEIKDSHVGSSE
ncbi:hypothetical protein KI387_012697, partial [Taxus chinensis]